MYTRVQTHGGHTRGAICVRRMIRSKRVLARAMPSSDAHDRRLPASRRPPSPSQGGGLTCCALARLFPTISNWPRGASVRLGCPGALSVEVWAHASHAEASSDARERCGGILTSLRVV